ncbi:hypothetical protein [Pseudoduganella violaceinigra]|uniref:hypothetical protein n=1 Tax=Pseudoduganella violaceinigra TaxID=246602 RepID=UPI00042308A6|nr:hypothetical protein [Pseudoduganella violaceinigra]
MMKTNRFRLAAALMLLACSFAAQGETQIDCEDPVKAGDYAFDFNMRLKAALAALKEKEIARQRRHEEAKDRIVAAGALSENEANSLTLDVATGSAQGQALESRRAKANKEFKTLIHALEGVPMIASNSKLAERRATCLLGQKAMTQLGIVDESSDAAWELVNQRLTALGKEKGVPGF